MPKKSWDEEVLDMNEGCTPPDTICFLLPAYLIPSDSTVIKKTGSYKYKLLREIRIFAGNSGEETQKIKARNGTVFLQSKNKTSGDYNIYTGDTMFLWEVSFEDAKQFLSLLKMASEGGK